MQIPKNGRIAIVDDNFSQALPLMELFGKARLPYLYYDGSVRGLPDEGSAANDIRLLFLDIYLNGDSIRPEKELRSSLIGVINRVISFNNYPYLLIFWSRHDKDHAAMVEDIFRNELRGKAPISLLSLEKTDYFELTSEKTILHEAMIPELMGRIERAIDSIDTYGNLLSWENLVHDAADKTLEEIFSFEDLHESWGEKSSKLFHKLGLSYSGKNLNSMSPSQSVKSAFMSFNFVFNDSLEYEISSRIDEKYKFSQINEVDISDVSSKINKKLLFATENTDKTSPGIVSLVDIKMHEYAKLLHLCILMGKILEEKSEIIFEKTMGIVDKEVEKKLKNKLIDIFFKEIKLLIKDTWLPVEVNVTPICDFAQGKEEYSRLIPGILIESKYRHYLDAKSEAIFISPEFSLQLEKFDKRIDGTYILVLDYRFFTSTPKREMPQRFNPILRVRQQLLTEIQSKLSRHISRQGILFFD